MTNYNSMEIEVYGITLYVEYIVDMDGDANIEHVFLADSEEDIADLLSADVFFVLERELYDRLPEPDDVDEADE